MKVFHSLDEFEKTGYITSAALGFFDGVHLGHRAVIESAVREKSGLCSVVLTFSQPPSKTITGKPPSLLTTNEEKSAIFAALGVDAVIFADFAVLKEMSAKDFVDIVLARQLRAQKVFCGFNYHFGSGGKGDTAQLCSLCAQNKIEAKIIDSACRKGEAISSTRIRACLTQGNIKEANEMLCRSYSLSGTVSAGNHIGSTLGFPTVNFPIDPAAVVPRFGVYASEILIDGNVYTGATNIGVHPTVKENASPLCETFLLDFEGGDLYNRRITCRLTDFIRPEKRFSSLEELQAQIQQDIRTISRAG